MHAIIEYLLGLGHQWWQK